MSGARDLEITATKRELLRLVLFNDFEIRATAYPVASRSVVGLFIPHGKIGIDVTVGRSSEC